MKNKKKLGKYFLAGMEPTGVYTFRLSASEPSIASSKDLIKKRISGNIGGFLGGATFAPLTSAASAAIAGKFIAKKSPDVGKQLASIGRKTLRVYFPKKIIKDLKNLKESFKHLKDQQRLVVSSVDNPVERKYKVIESASNIIKERRDIIKRTKHTPEENVERGLGIIQGLSSGIIGGGVGSLSANVQFSAGGKFRKKPK